MRPSEFDERYEDEIEDEHRVRGAILTEPIRALAPREPICVGPETRLRDAIELINAHKVGCALVVRDGQLVGIFTERDILRKVVISADLDDIVETIMTRDPETVRMDDGIAYALNKMQVGGYRHIPVVDRDSRPVGVVSVRDFVRFIVSLFPEAALNLPPEPELGIPRAPGGA